MSILTKVKERMTTPAVRLDPERMPRHLAVVVEELEPSAEACIDALIEGCARNGITWLTICAVRATDVEAWANAWSARAAARGVELELGPVAGREQLVAVARRIAAEVRQGRLRPQQVDAARISQYLEEASRPDPDLIICTGGRSTLAGALCWQLAYSELYLSEAPVAEFGPAELVAALLSYQGRERRFGRVTAAAGLSKAV